MEQSRLPPAVLSVVCRIPGRRFGGRLKTPALPCREYRVANPKEAHLFTILAFAAPRPLMFYLWAFNQKGVLESVFAAPTWGSLLQALRAPEDAAFSALSLVFPNLAVGVFATHVFWRLHPLIVLSYLCHAILPTFRQACSLVGIFSEEGSRLAKVADHTIGRAGLYAGGPLALLAVSASAAIAALRALKQLLIFDVASFTSAYAMHTAFYYTVPRAFQFLNLFTSIYLGPLMVFGKILVLAFQSAVRVCLRNPGCGTGTPTRLFGLSLLPVDPSAKRSQQQRTEQGL